MPSETSKETPRLPFFGFARDLCGFKYLQPSVLNREMADYHERIVNAWLDVRQKTNKRVKVAYILPRKARKSTLITQAGPAYELALDNELAIGIDSEKKERSNDFLGSTARIISGEAKTPWVTYMGNWSKLPTGKETTWRDDRIVIGPRQQKQRKEPSIFTLSVEIGFTGGAPDIIHIDDPMSPESHTELWMSTVQKHLDGLGPILMPNGLFCLCMTRYDDADAFGHIERTEGVHICEAKEAECCVRRGTCTHASDSFPEPWHVMLRKAWDENEKSIDEAVWTTAFLHAEQKKYPGFFAAQYLNNPWHNPDASFQPEDFCYASEIPPDVTTVLTSDIAWKNPTDRKTERGGDWNVLLRAKHHHHTGRVYVDEIRRGRWTEGEWGDELVKAIRSARTSKPPISRMVYEELRGGASFGHIAEVIRSACQRWSELAPALVKAIRSNTADNKATRIKSTAIYFQNHQAIFVRPCKKTEYAHDCPECSNFQILRNEMLKFGATLYDDAAECMADQFHPEIYHAPAVQMRTPPEPLHRYQYDDVLRPQVDEQAGVVMMMDEHDKPYWIQPDTYYYPREPV